MDLPTLSNSFYLKFYVIFRLVFQGVCSMNGDHGFIAELFHNGTDKLSSCEYPEYLNIRLNSIGLLNINLDLRRYQPVFNDLPNLLTNQRRASKTKNVIYESDSSPSSRLYVECKFVQKSTHISISGIIHHAGSEYIIRPYQFPALAGLDGVYVTVHVSHIVRKSLHTDALVVTKSAGNHHPVRVKREQRALSDFITFTLDVLVVVDNNIFLKWLATAVGRDPEEKIIRAKNEIRQYYVHVMNGVDDLFEHIPFDDFRIQIRLSEMIIMDNGTMLSKDYNSSKNVIAEGPKEANADRLLKTFRAWINNTEGLPAHHHAILFTGHDLYTVNENEEKISHTSGLAFIGTLCERGESVSIVEEQGGFQSIGTAAHEIGHSLGALHDGENNTCRSEDRYIMASSGFGPVPESKKYNPWIFSSCSVEYFKNFIATSFAGGSTCLSNITKRADRFTSVLNLTWNTNDLDLPGQHYSPDQQCQLIWGPTSYLCRGDEFGNASTLCTAMYCRDPSTVGDCVLHTAARGTSCGDQQWCMDGRCTFSERAPRTRGPCVLGDQPGPAFNDMTCSELVSVSPSYCYQKKVRARCCNTCMSTFTYRTGCEYGDRVQGCQHWHCSHFFESRDIQSECCGTCGTGNIITTTDINRALDIPLDVTSPVGHVSPDEIQCVDSQQSAGWKCADHIRERGAFLCYGHQFSKSCCNTCRQLNTNVEGCEFGDRVPYLCGQIRNKTTLPCSEYKQHCCASCETPTLINSSANSSLFSSHFFAWLFLTLLISKYIYIV